MQKSSPVAPRQEKPNRQASSKIKNKKTPQASSDSLCISQYQNDSPTSAIGNRQGWWAQIAVQFRRFRNLAATRHQDLALMS